MNKFEKDLKVILNKEDAIEIFRERHAELEELKKKQRKEKNKFRLDIINHELEKRKKEYQILDELAYGDLL